MDEFQKAVTEALDNLGRRIRNLETQELPEPLTVGGILVSDMNYMHGRRNLILNSGFFGWQFGTSITRAQLAAAAIPYRLYTADQWRVQSAATDRGTYTISRQSSQEYYLFDSIFCLEWAQTVAPSNSNYLEQPIENVTICTNQYVTLSFWARTIAGTFSFSSIQFGQNFGTGGSSTVLTTIASSVSVPNTWTKFVYTFQVPTISGKTIGSDHYIFIRWNVPSSGTWTFRIAQPQLEYGRTASQYEYLGPRGDIILLWRYLEKSYELNTAPATNTFLGRWTTCVSPQSTPNGSGWAGLTRPRFRVSKRTVPTMYLWDDSGTANQWLIGNVLRACTTGAVSMEGFGVVNNTGGAVTPSDHTSGGHWLADARF